MGSVLQWIKDVEAATAEVRDYVLENDEAPSGAELDRLARKLVELRQGARAAGVVNQRSMQMQSLDEWIGRCKAWGAEVTNA